MGSSVGPALAKQLISQLGNSGVAIQGVEYPATIESNISMGSEGGPEMAQLAEKALQNCPNTKIVLSGYSQGATVTHYAVAKGGLSATKVAAAVLYGDPEDGQAVGSLPSSKLKEFCGKRSARQLQSQEHTANNDLVAAGDGVCETHGFDITAAHLSYTTGSDISEGAQFIVQQTGASKSASAGGSTTTSTPSSGFGGFGGLSGLFGGF